VAALQAEFDWVILDGPPVTQYPDAASLVAAAGGAVLVLRAEHTRWEVADEARRVLENSGVDILGAVLNRRKYHIPGFIYRKL
jgi:Mrp family chromosome partitioning ATPase